MGIIKAIFFIGVFIIFWAMIGYPIVLNVLKYVFKNKGNKKDSMYRPTVTIMVVAHNEERVIGDKLNNLMELDYPKDKITYLIASDHSTDQTDNLVKEFISKHPESKIKLYSTVEHKGKTNAQNEAQKLVDSEILILTDANAIFKKDALLELVSSFSEDDIAYVCGKLEYVNSIDNLTAKSEGFYWKMDLMCREIESNIQTITAGNGAIYACRNKDYKKIEPIECHDASWPVLYALDKKRAVYNKEAVAYEKAGETDSDEFKRKVRMNRRILDAIMPEVRIMNIIKYGWFSFFYFGHRTCRYLLWLMHLLVFVSNIPLIKLGTFWQIAFVLQVLFYVFALIGWKTKTDFKLIKIIYYYCMTVAAQWHGVINILTGKAKPVWEKAESTR